MPGVEIKGYFGDIHSVNINLNAWNGNKGDKIWIFGIFLTFQ